MNKIHTFQELWPGHKFWKGHIRTFAGKHSSPELHLAKKIKMHLTEQKKNSNSLEYEVVLYFDLHPHPMAYTFGSIVMEWKQILFEV